MGLIDWFKKREEKIDPIVESSPQTPSRSVRPQMTVSVQLQFNPKKQDSVSVESLVKMLDDVKTIYTEHSYVHAHELIDKISNTISKLHSTHTIHIAKREELDNESSAD